MLTPRDIIWGIAAPTVLAAIALLLAHLPRRGQRDAQSWAPALAIAGGFAVALVGIRGLPAIPPVASDGWLALAAGPVLLVALLATFLPKQRGLDGSVSIIVLTLLAWLLLRRRQHAMEPKEFWTWTIVAAAAMAVWWGAMEALASRVRGVTLPVLLTITSMVAGAVLLNARSQAYGQLGGALGFTLVGVTAMAFWLRGLTLSRGGMLAVAAILLGLLLSGHHYADLRWQDLILLAAAPLTAWLGELPLLNRRPAVRFGVRLVALLVVLSIPFIPAVKGLLETMKEQSESYMY